MLSQKGLVRRKSRRSSGRQDARDASTTSERAAPPSQPGVPGPTSKQAFVTECSQPALGREAGPERRDKGVTAWIAGRAAHPRSSRPLRGARTTETGAETFER